MRSNPAWSSAAMSAPAVVLSRRRSPRSKQAISTLVAADTMRSKVSGAANRDRTSSTTRESPCSGTCSVRTTRSSAARRTRPVHLAQVVTLHVGAQRSRTPRRADRCGPGDRSGRAATAPLGWGGGAIEVEAGEYEDRWRRAPRCAPSSPSANGSVTRVRIGPSGNEPALFGRYAVAGPGDPVAAERGDVGVGAGFTADLVGHLRDRGRQHTPVRQREGDHARSSRRGDGPGQRRG